MRSSRSDPDWYAVLGLRRDATASQIKSAHRRRARLLHPDVNGAPTAHREMSLLNRAREVLLDSAQRAAFDSTHRERPHPTSAARPATRPRTPRPYTPAPPDPPDWYAFVGIEPGASSSEAVAALHKKRQWIREQHFSDEDYTRMSLLWREASEVLTNPRARTAYDRPRAHTFGFEGALPDWYALLGVRRTATVDEIAERVTELSWDKSAGRQFKRDLDEAWRTLRDPARRREYDAHLEAAVAR